jgi:RHS repeat-associated protein
VTVTYQHTDALGSPVATTNSSKTVLQRSEYEPYGKLLNRPMQDGPGYTGHVSDAATSLINMQQRYYDPRVGRFWSTDPVTALSGPFNRYWYANNNPYKFTDPDGRQSVGEMINSGAQGCGVVSCAGWAVLHAAWIMTGAEPLSQVADKGWSNVSTGDKIGAVSAMAAVVPVGRIAGKAVEGALAAKSATQIAQEGGRHAGQLGQFLKQTPDQLQRTIRSFDKNIAKHEGWIADPASKVQNFSQLRTEHQQNLLHHWQQDIIRHQELKSIAQDVLKGL